MFSKRRVELVKVMLRVVRFRKLLEEARGLVDLIQDAEEKLKGDYIFDRQYVLSLVDKVLDQAGRLVFDAHVLAPQGSETLYQVYDESKRFAQERFLLPPAETWFEVEVDMDEGGVLEESEVRMLHEVVQWLEGSSPAAGMSMMTLLKKVFDHAIRGVQSIGIDPKVARPVKFTCRDVHNRINLIELEPGEKDAGDTPSLQNLHCKPLALMAIGASSENDTKANLPVTTQRQWIAATNADQVSLQIDNAGRLYFLEASLTGYADSDFIFLYSKGISDFSSRMPEGFRLEKTESGEMAWRYDVPHAELEQNLIALGRILFGSPLNSGS